MYYTIVNFNFKTRYFILKGGWYSRFVPSVHGLLWYLYSAYFDVLFVCKYGSVIYVTFVSYANQAGKTFSN